MLMLFSISSDVNSFCTSVLYRNSICFTNLCLDNLSIFTRNLAFLIPNFYHTWDPVSASNHCGKPFIIEWVGLFFLSDPWALKPHVHAVESNTVKAVAKVIKGFFPEPWYYCPM